MKRISLLLGFLVACGGAQPKVTINNQQEYETVVTQLIDEVIEIFRAAGINCEMLTAELKSVDTSPKLTAAREWKASHSDAIEIAKVKIETRRAEIEKAAMPGMRQCGARVESVMSDLTE